MKAILKILSWADHRKSHLTDAIIRLNKLCGLEVFLLETAGFFNHKDQRKISFDNVKGMFALLATVKSVADTFSFASVESFKKLKLYFVQASGKKYGAERMKERKSMFRYGKIFETMVNTIFEQRHLQLQV